ncbi:MAG: DUF116 domain-containing protein [Nitrospiraceae bacterium]|nr:DUF116 domain-containing protein [Nitrospiraceae bacterium]
MDDRMAGADKAERTKVRDRKLGDEWADWKGDGRDQVIDEKITTFFFLSAGVVLIFAALLTIVWYLIKPRMEQFNPLIAGLAERSLIFFIAVLLFLLALEGAAVVKFGKSFLPYRLMEGILLSVLPKTVWLGEKFGISRDRVGNSFIKVHNYFAKSRAGTVDPERLLILLPRCLKKEARDRVLGKVNGDAVKVLTVAGGEEAREAIRELRPTLILALACERDLMSGIKDVAGRVPVLAVANKRPEGPCRNTDFSVDELDGAMNFIRERRDRKPSGRK